MYRTSRKSDPDEEPLLPIKIDTTTNGEIPPSALSPGLRLARELALERAGASARRLGLSRRAFLNSSAGAASTLLCLNDVYAAQRGAGYYAVDPEMRLDEAKAAAALQGDELIFDVQTHHVTRGGFSVEGLPQSRCGERDPVECFSAEHYVEEVFLNSDTTLAVLSHTPSLPGAEPLPLDDAVATAELVAMTKGSPRLQLHAQVAPPFQESLEDDMLRIAESYEVKAWKTYTHFGNWYLDDPIGIRFIEAARATGVKRIAIHKGLSQKSIYATCRDVGPVAAMFPDVSFLIYHSGYETVADEGPYDPAALWGTSVLVKSLQDAGVAPNSNVFAELGSTWRAVAEPVSGAHVLGKLLRYVGEDNLLWGTDSIWYGSPQDQILRFRSFEIGEQYQQLHGYPPLTPELKAKVFGLNAMKVYGIDPEQVAAAVRADFVASYRRERGERARPTHRTYGPRTRRDFLTLLRMNGGRPL